MAAIDLISQIVIAAGFLAALLWSLRAALRAKGRLRLLHGVNVALLAVSGGAIALGLALPGLVAGLLLLLTTLLAVPTERQDPLRWLLMVQFVFALFVASGVPFRGGPA